MQLQFKEIALSCKTIRMLDEMARDVSEQIKWFRSMCHFFHWESTKVLSAKWQFNVFIRCNDNISDVIQAPLDLQLQHRTAKGEDLFEELSVSVECAILHWSNFGSICNDGAPTITDWHSGWVLGKIPQWFVVQIPLHFASKMSASQVFKIHRKLSSSNVAEYMQKPRISEIGNVTEEIEAGWGELLIHCKVRGLPKVKGALLIWVS